MLIQSVFTSIPIHYMAYILFGKSFLARITAIISSGKGLKKTDKKAHSL
jgi:hypothetical protein